jgi:hypothetical protein
MRYTEEMVPEWLQEAQRAIRIDGKDEGENTMFGATIEDEETIMNRILEQRYGESAILEEEPKTLLFSELDDEKPGQQSRRPASMVIDEEHDDLDDDDLDDLDDDLDDLDDDDLDDEDEDDLDDDLDDEDEDDLDDDLDDEDEDDLDDDLDDEDEEDEEE